MQASLQRWLDWVGGIAAQNKLVDRGSRLEREGKVVKASNVVTDGPYTELKESLLGYTIVKADDLDDATKLAENCPILFFGGNVEVREIAVI